MTRRTWVLAATAALVAVIVTGVAVALPSAKRASSATTEQPANTVPVEKRQLSAMVSVDGALTYRAQPDGSPYSVINQASGTYTELPEAGQVISPGQVLYRVNDSPVVLLYGSTPVYRTLSIGATGADVAELNADLVALGYATSAQLSPTSSYFGAASAAAVEKLQATLEVTRNGTMTLGQAVFEPTALRVTILSAPLGGNAQTGQTVMQATSTTRQVQVALDVAQQTDVAVGDTVTITLPNNETTRGVVASVGTVATCPSSSGSGSSSAGLASLENGTCSSGTSGASTTPVVALDVTPSDPASTGTWDEAPVQVSITTASVPSALVVPVTALLAQSGGGYAVEESGANGINQLVAVSLGLFDDADGLVQVTGSDLAAGQRVVVPST